VIRLVGRYLRAAGDVFDPPPPPRPQPRWYSPRESLFERSPGLDAERREHAMSLMDDDTLGYVLVRCRREPNGQAGMQLGIALEDAAWPAMGETLQRVILEAGRVHA
jgi:hypothetical protein